MHYYIRAFKKYCTTDGRASRKELLLFFLFHYLVTFTLSFLDGLFGFYSTTIPLDYGYMTLAYLLLSICPAACVQIRRLHDINKSGTWWFLFNLPLVCLYMIYLYLKRGDSGANQYGDPPDFEKETFGYEMRETQKEAVVGDPGRVFVATETFSGEKPKIQFCHRCGNKLIENCRFCDQCGTEIDRG